MEKFKDIDNYPDYEVSSLGYVRNKVTGHKLSTKANYVLLSNGSTDGYVNISIKQLVAKSFLDNPQNFPVVNLVSSNYSPRFSVDNLKWGFPTKDLSGRQLGELTILELINSDGIPAYKCLCTCGEYTIKRHDYFANKTRSKSCGCILKKPRKHGMCNDITYIRWSAMKTRATNPNFIRADCYLEKGITLCDKWLTFEGFLNDMGTCPSDKHSLDRVDNNLGYSKENCRWVLYKVQSFNKRSKNELLGKVTGIKKLPSGNWCVMWRQDGKTKCKTFCDFMTAVLFRQEKEILLYGFSKINLANVNEGAYD